MKASTPTLAHARRPLKGMRSVLLVMEQDVGYHGGVLLGASAYARRKRRWVFEMITPGYADPLDSIAYGKPDGILLNVLTPSWAQVIRSQGIPAVNIGFHVESDLPRVGVDDVGLGRMAADYFLSRGFSHFGCFGDEKLPFSYLRAEGFRRVLGRHGFRCSVCNAFEGRWDEYQRFRTEWLLSLPKPVAVFASSDFFGMVLIEACHRTGLRIPEDVAVLGADNNELLCEMTHPPMGSIVTPSARIGFRAAQLLDRLMRGGAEPKRPILLKAPGVVTRQSSDISAVHDPDLAAAIRFIRQNAHRPLDVAEVLRHVPISRRSLERRFREALGRAPLDEIRRVHVEQAKDLLARTDLTTDEVAQRSGFTNPCSFAMIFKKSEGMTPTAYRRLFRTSDLDTRGIELAIKRLAGSAALARR